MPSVRNVFDAPPQTDSNVALFEMMMYYKRTAEATQEHCQRLERRAERHAREMSDLQIRLHAALESRRATAAANVRGAHMVVRKHDAGMRMVRCIDDLFNAIELAYQTRMDTETGIQYLKFEKDRIEARATMAFELLIQEHDEPDLEADEVIDLIGETTEEESEEEVEI